jgi:predicted nucleic acid-binding protein
LRPEDTFLSVITMGEVIKGVLRLPRGPKRIGLKAWLESIDRQFASHILPVDRETAQIWGEICAAGEARGRVLPPGDGLIAATAIQHGLRVWTRNISDFADSGALVSNPWEG